MSAHAEHVDMETNQPIAGPSSHTPGSESEASTMEAVYFQSRSAQVSGYKDVLITVSQDESYGKKLTIQSPNTGSFEDHGKMEDTLHGSRVMKGNETVNQSVSVSFDPSKLICSSCGNECPVIFKKPAVILLSDQNFDSQL